MEEERKHKPILAGVFIVAKYHRGCGQDCGFVVLHSVGRR